MNIPTIRLTALSAVMLAAGCTTIEERPVALNEARQTVRAAMADPHVPRFAPMQLNQAGRLLDEAERHWGEGADMEVVAHQAYLADRQARIALATARARAAREEIDQADAQRQRIVSESRREQAEAARQRAEAERMRADKAREFAEAARREAAARLAQARAASDRSAHERELAQQEIRRLEDEMNALRATRTARGWELSLGSEVLFDVGEATLKPGARHAIEKLRRFMESHPDRSITIEGFTDSTGSDDMNFELSLRRAQAVERELVSAGIDPSRIDTRGYGEGMPIASNDTVAGRQLNRRVDVVIQEPTRSAASR